jgi:Uma2 family endonuclease
MMPVPSRADVNMAYIVADMPSTLSADAFLAMDQRSFGSAWRYELVDGRIVGQAAPSPRHGIILNNLATALTVRMSDPGRPDGCYPEVGSGAAPRNQQNANARVPDALIRCGDHPRVIFEVVSPSELKAWPERDDKRLQLQDVAGVQEIFEIYQDQMAAHVYRKGDDGTWRFASIGGEDATLDVLSVGVRFPLAELYWRAMPAEDAERAQTPAEAALSFPDPGESV